MFVFYCLSMWIFYNISHAFVRNSHVNLNRPIQSSKNILVLGGNGLIGAPTVERLIDAGHYCTLINRGNWYWDTIKTIKPRVRHIQFDRMQSLGKCQQLMEIIKNNEKFDTIIDFSAYHVFAVREVINLLKGISDLYIFISSDSVYEVCLKNHTQPSLETDAIRPTVEELKQKLGSKDDYGHRKLEIEEELALQRIHGGIPYISLRLPDVVGPRDNTYRWLLYQTWMRLHDYLDVKLHIPSYLSTQYMSLVYSEDVADLIAQLVNNEIPENAFDEAYNLAFHETFTLKQLLMDMKRVLNLTDIEIAFNESNDAVRFFPSVTLGPVNISKAREKLNWTPITWEIALNRTVMFYENALTKEEFEAARRDIIRSLQIYFSHHPFRVLIGMKREYGVHYPLSKEEL